MPIRDTTGASAPFEHSPDFAAWLTPITPGLPDDPDEYGNTLRNVRFENCDRSSLAVQDCHWQNVLGAHCKLSNTTFRNVKLANVALVHLDFDKVTVIDLELFCHFWRNLQVANALLSQNSLVPSSSETYSVAIKAPQISSKTLDKELTLDLLPDCETKRNERGDWTSGRTINALQPREVLGRDLLTPLVDHYHIIDRIMQLVFSGPSIQICEYANGDALSANHAHQQRYTVNDSNSRNKQRSMHTTTYFACQHVEALDAAKPVTSRPPNNQPCCDFTPSFMQVSKACYQLVPKYFFGHTFRFQCSARGVHRFLAAHKRHIHFMTGIELFYHFDAEPGIIETNDEQFHDLLFFIRHNLSFVPNIHVHIGHHFWSKAKWTQGPQAVVGQTTLRDDSQVQPPFLWDVEKIALPADRWANHDDPSTHRVDGTEVQISIEGTMSEEEVVFVEELNQLILKRGTARPLFVRDSSGMERTYTRTRNERICY